MNSLVRDSAFGQIARLTAAGRKIFPYLEEAPGWTVPWDESKLKIAEEKEAADAEKSSDTTAVDNNADTDVDATPDGKEEHEEVEPAIAGATGADLEKQASRRSQMSRVKSRESTRSWTVERHETEVEHEAAKAESVKLTPTKTKDGVILVDWYDTTDQENPQNWPVWRKNWTSAVIVMYTFAVYCGSSIYTSGTEDVMMQFNIGYSKAALVLSMYVLGYGLGPLLFSPMSEIPVFGRNIPYVSTFFLFVILGIPLAVVDNYAGLLVLRFLTGFLGSPCLATGGATMQDLYSFMKLPYAFTTWVAAAFCAPALGPLLSGYAVIAKGWRWAFWEIVWMSAPVLVLMVLVFPETSAANIQLNRAKRIRKATGNPAYKSQSEIDQANIKFSSIFRDAVVKPFQITLLDPAVLFTNGYTALIYGIYYSFFEVFPIVFVGFYGFNIGALGIVFTCIIVGAVIGITIYCLYIHYYLTPDIMKRGLRAQEHRLVPALFASMGLPAGLFIFAWTSRPDIHWIVPIIGITLFAASAFVLMQCVFIYLPLSYPPYAASLFAANDFFRSAMAGGSIVYARPLFINLGVGRGTSLLGGLAVGGVIGIWLLWIFGAKLRAKSKFAMS